MGLLKLSGAATTSPPNLYSSRCHVPEVHFVALLKVDRKGCCPRFPTHSLLEADKESLIHSIMVVLAQIS